MGLKGCASRGFALCSLVTSLALLYPGDQEVGLFLSCWLLFRNGSRGRPGGNLLSYETGQVLWKLLKRFTNKIWKNTGRSSGEKNGGWGLGGRSLPYLQWRELSVLFPVVKNQPTSAGDRREAGSVPGSGGSPRGRNGKPLQGSCLENPMDRGAWWATVQRVAKGQTQLQWLSTDTPKIWRCHVLLFFFLIVCFMIASRSVSYESPVTLFS